MTSVQDTQKLLFMYYWLKPRTSLQESAILSIFGTLLRDHVKVNKTYNLYGLKISESPDQGWEYLGTLF